MLDLVGSDVGGGFIAKVYGVCCNDSAPHLPYIALEYYPNGNILSYTKDHPEAKGDLVRDILVCFLPSPNTVKD